MADGAAGRERACSHEAAVTSAVYRVPSYAVLRGKTRALCGSVAAVCSGELTGDGEQHDLLAGPFLGGVVVDRDPARGEGVFLRGVGHVAGWEIESVIWLSGERYIVWMWGRAGFTRTLHPPETSRRFLGLTCWDTASKD